MAERIAVRTCSKCRQPKPESEEFFRRRGTKHRGGLRPDCRECTKARDRAYFRDNRDKVLAYREKNREQIAAYQAAYMPKYYATPRGRATMRRAALKWDMSPRGRRLGALASQRRRARVANLDSTFTADDWALCLDLFEHRCAYCGTDGRMDQDHVVPVERGGPYVATNIVPACISCNSSKTTKPLAEWYPAQLFYSEERLMFVYAYLEAVA